MNLNQMLPTSKQINHFHILFFQGLEHLMHNLGLGDLEFDPGHTVDQHRPDGYKVPDIIVEEDKVQKEFAQNIDEIIDGERISVQIREDRAASKSNSETTTTQPTKLDRKSSTLEPKNPTEYLNEITWKSDDWEDMSFASLHNPKHVHHKPHGE